MNVSFLFLFQVNCKRIPLATKPQGHTWHHLCFYLSIQDENGVFFFSTACKVLHDLTFDSLHKFSPLLIAAIYCGTTARLLKVNLPCFPQCSSVYSRSLKIPLVPMRDAGSFSLLSFPSLIIPISCRCITVLEIVGKFSPSSRLCTLHFSLCDSCHYYMQLLIFIITCLSFILPHVISISKSQGFSDSYHIPAVASMLVYAHFL